MKLAVVTPHYRTPLPWLERCLQSVAGQSVPCTHILVCDGEAFPQENQYPQVQVIKLPRPHGGFGNTARAIGSISAIAQEFEAIAYLDADNWYEPNHLQLLVETQQRTDADFCSSARMLFTLEGERLGLCPEVDGDRFVDTNCMFFTQQAYHLIPTWFFMPEAYFVAGDRWVWGNVRESGITRAHHGQPTVGYRTRHAVHYRHFGKSVPQGSKEIIRIQINE